MKKLTVVFLGAILACFAFADCKTCGRVEKTKLCAAQNANAKSCSKSVAKPAKAESKAAAKETALEKLVKKYKKYPNKIGVLSITPNENNIVLSFGANDGLKEDEHLILFKEGKPMLEVTVTELSDDQISATFVQGDHSVFSQGDSLVFYIPASEK